MGIIQVWFNMPINLYPTIDVLWWTLSWPTWHEVMLNVDLIGIEWRHFVWRKTVLIGSGARMNIWRLWQLNELFWPFWWSGYDRYRQRERGWWCLENVCYNRTGTSDRTQHLKGSSILGSIHARDSRMTRKSGPICVVLLWILYKTLVGCGDLRSFQKANGRTFFTVSNQRSNNKGNINQVHLTQNSSSLIIWRLPGEGNEQNMCPVTGLSNLQFINSDSMKFLTFLVRETKCSIDESSGTDRWIWNGKGREESPKGHLP